MNRTELDESKSQYQAALQHWIETLGRLQTLLADTTHSAKSQDIWGNANLDQEKAQASVKSAREAYEEAVRKANFNF